MTTITWTPKQASSTTSSGIARGDTVVIHGVTATSMNVSIEPTDSLGNASNARIVLSISDSSTGSAKFTNLYLNLPNLTLTDLSKITFVFDDGSHLLFATGSSTFYSSNSDDYIIADIAGQAIFGEDGNDFIVGNDGRDQIFGGNGNDTLEGKNDGDVLYGDAGNDALFGDYQDYLYGGNGNDYLQRGGWMYGGSGNDTLAAASDGSFARGDDGNDQIYGDIGSDYFMGDQGDDTLAGDDGNDHLEGNAGNDLLWGGAGNDTLIGGAGNDTLNGGAGYETIEYDGLRARFSMTKQGDATQIIDTNGSYGIDLIRRIETVYFNDDAISFDISGNAGQAFRLYQATFGRTPDREGLGYWIDDMENNHASLLQVAQNFVISSEFIKLYGSNPSADKLLTGFYQNILGRKPDAEGYAYWKNVLATGKNSTAEVLLNFSESAESKKLTANTTEQGMSFSVWGSKTGTAAHDVLIGNRGDDTLRGLDESDYLIGGKGHDVLDGGNGIDFAIYQSNDGFPEIIKTEFGLETFNPNDSADHDVLINVERIVLNRWDDPGRWHGGGSSVVAFDIDGNAGQVFRLLHAASLYQFDRIRFSLGNLIEERDAGASLQSIANDIVKSDFFLSNFSSNLSVDLLITSFYNKILEREVDQTGFNFWKEQINTGKMSVADVLISFSESQEYKVKLAGSVEHGIEYGSEFFKI